MGIMKKKGARDFTVGRIVAGAAVILFSATVVETSSSGITTNVVHARAAFSEPVDIKLKVGNAPQVIHVAQAADTVMQQLVFGPGGQSGWHSHPGPAIVLVKSGELTLYSGDDPNCEGHAYGVGQAFIDSGQGHVHLARNEGSVDAEVWVTYLDVPPGTPARIDATDPGNCQF